MDFPNDITTNVFRVGDIKEIHWAVYTRRPKDGSDLQNSPSNEDEDDLAHLLQLAACTLRENGRHVTLDKDKAGLWVFSLSQALDEGTAQSLGLDGLECTSAGSVHSGDLVAASSSNASALPSIKTARSTQSAAAAIGELNTQAFGSNAGSNTQRSINEPGHKRREAWGASQEHSILEVYSKFISAVSYSLSRSLGNGKGWIQVGPDACIDMRTLEDDLFDCSELQSWVATTTKICFDVKWLSSGILLISVFQVQLPRHIRMSTIISKDGKSASLAVGAPLLLSPFGIRCQYLGTEDLPNSDVQRKSTAQVKASILSRLGLEGIRDARDVMWIQVQMGRESIGFVGPPVSLWPADLCFCGDVMTPHSGEDGESFNRCIMDGSIDPLEEAESWFLGKAARMDLLQARVREENQGAEETKDVEDTEDEDALSPIELPMDQGITPQDVSGIYPTPPDGLPLALLGSSNPNDLQSGDYDDEDKELQPSDGGRGDYDGQGNDDLFEDMDIDMFASNGLTEADFSFFDEPGMMDEDLRETGQVMTLDDTNETTDDTMAFHEQGLTTTPYVTRDSGSDRNISEGQEDAIGEQESVRVLPMTDNNRPDKYYEQALESTVNIGDIDYGALEQLNLRHGTTHQDAHGSQRGSFEHVPFQGSTFNFDDKYNMKGRFAFDVDELPTHPKRGDRPYRENHLSKISFCPEKSPTEDSVNTADDEENDSPALEDADFHDVMNLSLELQAESSRKRKREQNDDNDHPVTPSSSVHLAKSLAGSPQNELDEPMLSLSEPNAFEETKDMVDLDPQNHIHSTPSFTGQGQAFVGVAQLIAHQAVSGILQSQTECFGETNLVGESGPDRSLQNTMTHLLSTFFPANKRCSLKEYVSLGEKNSASVSKEQVILNQRSLKPTHMAGGLTATGQSIFKLDSPYTRVRRNGVSIEISASALSFWEELSLGPSHETKDIDVFCVCPKNKYIAEGIMAFLNMIKGTYQSCNLGSHDLGASLADNSKRVLTVPMDARKPDNFLQNIAVTCEGLGAKLPELGLQSGTTVIYIINPFNDQQYLPGLCDALLRVPSAYSAALEKRRLERHNNLVMQIVPLDLVWSQERMVVPSPAVYRKLAFEVYNNCGSSESDHNRESYFMGTPAIRLAKAVPKTIDFKLGSESSALFLQSDNCVHVSYTWDASNEWLAAWWTDNLGVLSWRACYCLGKNEETPWKPFYESFKEILETSFEMLHPPNAPWRLFICKDSPIAKMEIDVWLQALADSSRPSTSCTILTVDAQPLLAFPSSDLQMSSSDVGSGPLATPGATPHTNAPSPDISGLGSTPAGNPAQVGTPPANAAFGDHDSEARLIDVTDETWGVVMDGTLDDLNTLTYQSASMASGYLVKRAGPRDEDGLIPLGVNLIHGQKPYKAVLKEVLGMYRNLGTLARVRGVVDPVKSVLPLHVAAARKAWKALSETMRYKPE
ncbi:hypothetical protein HO133_007609 [Letharia lupina]|uniref:Mediator of RNA polymerase II transcription subunit 13 n=1 Tax=Letharia lupina TaxID=560253 RepID=A0A8H6CRG1_9LECA|nr:uncharacterized protein HO133_007609 [Letharia lupina]KAF6227881.1 hypothetical protein HO133_007609 [Letharia lupina]